MSSLFHYTNFDGLKGIIDSKKLWLSNRKCLNDSSEYVHSKPIFIKIVEDFLENKNFKYHPEILNLLFSEESDFIHRALLKASGDSYIFSTCIHENKKGNEHLYKNGLLSMWRAYGAAGGYAIEFDEDEIKKIFNESSCLTVSGKVVYTRSSDKEIPKELIEQDENFDLEKHINDFLEDFVDKRIRKDLENLEINEDRIRATLEISCLIKHIGFKEESEYRFCKFIKFRRGDELRRGDEPSNFSIRKSGSGINQYIEVPIDLSCIKRIIVGPHEESSNAADFIKKYIESKGESINVTISRIPYIEKY